jgi:hypothetical protein
VPQHEVAEAERLHYGAEQEDDGLVNRGVAHVIDHLLIRYCSNAALSVLERAEL